MTTVVDATRLYDDALRGEPLQRTVFPPPLNTLTSIWTLGEWPLVLPASTPRPAPEVQRVAKQIREWTGWSARRLAEVLATTHTTILGVENGRALVGGHSGDLRRRLMDAYDVIQRVVVLAGHDPGAITRLLETAPPGRRAALAELQADKPARAHLAAIDVLRPQTPGLIVGDRPRSSGGSAALHD